MTAPLILAPRLDTDAAAALAEQLAARPGPALGLDGREVRHLGTLCALELAAAAERIRARGGTVEIAMSAAMRDDLRLLGLLDLVAGPEGAP
ncbi:hypothetical protein [Roseivivax sp. CAU 1761]